MSISYYHRITAIGNPSGIKKYKDSYQERLRSSIINYFGSYAVDNELCDIVSLDEYNNISSIEIPGDNPLYYKYGIISPDRFYEEFVNEIDVKCDSDTKYSFDIHTKNRSLSDEIYLLSSCFPKLLFHCHTWNDTDAYGSKYYVMKAGEQLDWVHVQHIPQSDNDLLGLPDTTERDYSPTKHDRHISIRIYGADNELLSEL